MTTVHLTAIVMIVAVGVAYFVFLYASWNQFQKDRANRDDKIDEMLARLPKPAPNGTSE
jgi:predicted RND superfamily exporter protein